MKLILIRHARAIAREAWKGDALLRPLTGVGRDQAEALGEHLEREEIARIVSARGLRSQQTAEPLALRCGIPVESDERLGEDESVERALEIVAGHRDGALVLCTHRRLVAGILDNFGLPGNEAQPACPKGSAWILEGAGRSFSQARYVEPLPAGRHPATTRPSPASVRAATLDLGSTSFNLLIADVTPSGVLRPMVTEKVMLRLGAVIADHGSIPEEVCERCVEVARALRGVAEQEKVQLLLPVATASIRDAANGAELADRIGRALGTPVRVLSGVEEARLIFRAFQQRLDLGDQTTLGIDLGGGSLELALGSAHGIQWEATLPLGVARLHRELVTHDPLKKSEVRSIRRKVAEHLAPHLDAIRELPFARAVAAGGTVRALGRLLREKRWLRRAPSIQVLRVGSLERLTRELVRARHEERLRMRGMRRTRADLLPAGGLILSELARALEIRAFEISDWGLREGAMLEALATAPRSR